MQTRVSTKGQIVLPGALRRKLDIRSGDRLNISLERDGILLKQDRKPMYEARIVKDPVTGWPVLDAGPDAPILTSEMVKEMLADFP
ncbi:MAG: AbrB/MazE/SpoVT family DNA-binding domain-containing protein [Terracidiphilus sp.]